MSRISSTCDAVAFLLPCVWYVWLLVFHSLQDLKEEYDQCDEHDEPKDDGDADMKA